MNASPNEVALILAAIESVRKEVEDLRAETAAASERLDALLARYDLAVGQ